MAKRLLIVLLSLLLTLSLSGCWNYRSLDQLNLVVGIAIDFDKQNNLFDISYEVANKSSSDMSSDIQSRIIRSQGKTLMDTARNAKNKEADKLFFGCSQVLVLSKDLAMEMDISSILDWFLRDAECRETLCVAISQEETAAEILKGPDKMNGIMSSIAHDIIREDRDVTGLSTHSQLYEIYNALNSPRQSAVLPVLRKVKSDEGEINEINGSAVIKGSRLVGFLTPQQSRGLLFAEDTLNRGVITLSLSDEMPGDDLTLEIFKNNTKKSYSYEQGLITVYIETETNVSIDENRSHLDVMDKQVVEQIKSAAARKIESNIKEVADILQHKLNTDVLGFGEMIYKGDLPLWHELAPQWEEIYPTVEVKVASKVNIINSSFNK
ncbi:Ger(x)C family spore germination protein [Oscillospiraceae bacterium MB08-C2-2]|nr:Ger(x)C family spore germination protein [Oscillospiraceae bacterium MB08-C2-2]